MLSLASKLSCHMPTLNILVNTSTYNIPSTFFTEFRQSAMCIIMFVKYWTVNIVLISLVNDGLMV